jgi:hypothetical protein
MYGHLRSPLSALALAGAATAVDSNSIGVELDIFSVLLPACPLL